MAHRCSACGSRLVYRLVDHYRIDGAHRLVLYQGVRHYRCNRCQATALFDYSRARPVRPGEPLRTTVNVTRRRLSQPAGFNDYLLTLGLLASAALFAAAIAAMPVSFGGKAAGWLALLAIGIWVYVSSTHRLEYSPSVYLPPIQPAPPSGRAAQAAAAPATVAREAAARPRPAAAPAAATAAVAASAAPAAGAAVEQAAPVKGGDIPITIHYEGETHSIQVNAGENLLMAALDRNVNLEYSCLEGMCDTCMVRVLNGMNNLSEPTR
ncbi:MAG TPA: 2Fe-2S iron-sulfur cluster-binding protein, partial [Limnochordia bacterium]